ncbi:hypothetical protein J1N35_020754 [Gossypium stocksii]|uniref:Uncharacterized protein n=1 Tax=Gossypium stocksii TaxID=47602 RepID=A0A9D4A0P2_9ROSI|nr:hypothetical protein J1N35_020754 [Gossypium stocksii]
MLYSDGDLGLSLPQHCRCENLRKLTATALLCFACLSLTNLRILRQPFGFPVFRIFLDLTACLMLNIDDSFLSISSFA